MNIAKMMKDAQRMQEELQKKLAEVRVEGSSGGGIVPRSWMARRNLLSIRISKEAIDPNDIEMLQDLNRRCGRRRDAPGRSAIRRSDGRVDGGMMGGLRFRPRLMIDTGTGNVIERLVHELMSFRESAGRPRSVSSSICSRDRPTRRSLSPARSSRFERKFRACANCFNFSESERVSHLHRSEARPIAHLRGRGPVNVAAIERAGGYRGLYHVLGGTLSPLAGVGPDDITIASWSKRIGRREGPAPPAKAPPKAVLRRMPGAGRGSHPGHQPDGRGRGDGDPRRERASPRSESASPVSRRGLPVAETSNTPTRSRSPAPCPAAAKSTDFGQTGRPCEADSGRGCYGPIRELNS